MSTQAKSAYWFRALLLVAAIALVGAALPLGALWYLNQPTYEYPARQIHIPQGANARWIGQLLERENLIRNAHVFVWTVRLKGLGHQLKAGTYQLDGNGTTAAIVQSLLKAPIQTQPATIPEGLNRHQIAAHLQAAGVADSARFIAATEDPHLIRQLGVVAPSLEGYLFPETYFFDLNTDEHTIASLMVDQFHRVFADSLHQRLKEIGLSLHEAVTLASIVEREAVAVEEQPIISGVFQRRLKLNRRLESCATVNYALGTNKKRLTYADLEVDSPFNTYRYQGLPPGPISNPGRTALLSVLYPEETEYLYFVARGDGTHIFSRTNREHERAKRQVKLAQRMQTN
ncbi:MAG: endolytic transglycosylase MltG [Gemmatimonadota bacterium]|nr:endolytic transglycosylase MltG [Gemmatimonadota bacterium]